MKRLALDDVACASRVVPTIPPKLRLSRLLALVGLAALLLGLPLGIPRLLWFYHIHQAGRLMERGLDWPIPRASDSLPGVSDRRLAGRALTHLAAASRWRPDDAFTQRMASRVYAAQGDWLEAAAALGAARSLRPRDPLLAWESGLVYEHMERWLPSQPSDNILAELASQPIIAPDQPIETVYCRDDLAQTCYVNLDTYTQSYAAFPDVPPVTADVLFMHPPAAVRLTRLIEPPLTALFFLQGLDPGVRAWTSDGATFEIWVAPMDGPSQPVYSQTLDAATARRGWVAGSADLASWAGQTVTLEFRTTGGPSGSTADDWFGWGDVTLTTPQAATSRALLPEMRRNAAWRDAGRSGHDFAVVADRLRVEGSYDEALRWYQRARQVMPDDLDVWLGIAKLCQQTSLPEPDVCDEALARNDGNLLVDAGFAFPRLFSMWDPYEYVPATSYQVVACPGKPQQRCAHIAVSASGAEHGAGLYQCVMLEPGTTYRFSVWAKVDLGQSGTWRPLYISGTVAGQEQAQWSPAAVADPGQDWTFHEYMFTAAAYDNKAACLHPLRLQGHGEAWFYGARLEAIDEA